MLNDHVNLKLYLLFLIYLLGIDNPGAPTNMFADDPALNCSVANLTT